MPIGWPSDLTWYKLFTDWGSLFGGVFVLIAGVFAYAAGRIQASATRRAAADQIAETRRKDRLQAHCMAVGIYPEILKVRASYERAFDIIANAFPKMQKGFTTQIVEVIRDARIVVPPLLNRSIDQLYVLEEAGATMLQLLSVILQYNSMVDALAKQISDDANSFDPSTHLRNFSGHLGVIPQLLDEAELQIKPFHDDAGAGV
jgi:hypothetical protein